MKYYQYSQHLSQVVIVMMSCAIPMAKVDNLSIHMLTFDGQSCDEKTVLKSLIYASSTKNNAASSKLIIRKRKAKYI